MTSRRTFLAGAVALAAAPLGAQERRQYRIGMLETVPIAANNANLGELHRGMQDLGHEEGLHTPDQGQLAAHLRDRRERQQRDG